MVHPDHLQTVTIEALLRAPERQRIDQVAVARRVGPLVDEGHELQRHLAVPLDRSTDQAARLGRVVRLAVAADRRHLSRIQHQRHRGSSASRPRSLK
jgi:hypothetical protein